MKNKNNCDNIIILITIKIIMFQTNSPNNFVVISIWDNTYVYHSYPNDNEASFRAFQQNVIIENLSLEKRQGMMRKLDEWALLLINYGNNHVGQPTNNQIAMLQESWGESFEIRGKTQLGYILNLVYYGDISFNLRNQYGFEIRRYNNDGVMIYSNKYEEFSTNS